MSPKPDLVYQWTAYSHIIGNLLDGSFFFFFLTRRFHGGFAISYPFSGWHFLLVFVLGQLQ